MVRALALVSLSLAFTGWAAVAGADCKLTNDYGSTAVKSGDTAQVRRSSKDLDIVCKHPDNPDASARAISRAAGAGRRGGRGPLP